jgi:hypothetical protein
VSDVRLDRKNDAVDAVITNPGSLLFGTKKANAYAVLYNSAGGSLEAATLARSGWLPAEPALWS